jgi:hypothetical protein
VEYYWSSSKGFLGETVSPRMIWSGLHFLLMRHAWPIARAVWRNSQQAKASAMIAAAWLWRLFPAQEQEARAKEERVRISDE